MWIYVASNAVDGSGDRAFVEHSGGFDDHMTFAVADQDLHSDFGIMLCFICEVHDGTRDSVCHLVRVARIHFFYHLFLLLALSSFSIASSCGEPS